MKYGLSLLSIIFIHLDMPGISKLIMHALDELIFLDALMTDQLITFLIFSNKKSEDDGEP
jgi:hypothetical protein